MAGHGPLGLERSEAHPPKALLTLYGPVRSSCLVGVVGTSKGRVAAHVCQTCNLAIRPAPDTCRPHPVTCTLYLAVPISPRASFRV